jgi:serine/threonine-protein kinase
VVSSGANASIPPGLFAPYEMVRELGARPHPVYAVRRAAPGAGGKGQLAVAERFEDAARGATGDEVAFVREARRIATLASPNLARARDVVTRGEDLVIFGEFVDGEKLAALWPPQDLPLEIALRLILDVLGGVGTLHNARDAKQQPMNLAHGEVSAATVVFGTDGIARMLHAVARRFPGVEFERASAGYLAPEVALGEPFDGRADVYGAGVLLWEALSQRRLFAEGEAGDLAKQVRERGVPSAEVSEKAAWAKGLVDVAAKALVASPDGRWATAAAMAAEVRKAAGLKLAPASAAGAFARKAIGERVKTRREALEGPASTQVQSPGRRAGGRTSSGPPAAAVAPRAPAAPAVAAPAVAPPAVIAPAAAPSTLAVPPIAQPALAAPAIATPTAALAPVTPAAIKPKPPATLEVRAIPPALPQSALPKPSTEVSAGTRAPEVVELEGDSVLDAAPTLPPPAASIPPTAISEPPVSIDLEARVSDAPGAPVAPVATEHADVALLAGLPPPTVPVEPPPPIPAFRSYAESAAGPGPLSVQTSPEARRRKAFVLGGVAAVGLLVFGLAAVVRLAHRSSSAESAASASASAAAAGSRAAGAPASSQKPGAASARTAPPAAPPSAPTVAAARPGSSAKAAAPSVAAGPPMVPATAHAVATPAHGSLAATAHAATPSPGRSNPAKPRTKPFVPNSL